MGSVDIFYPMYLGPFLLVAAGTAALALLKDAELELKSASISCLEVARRGKEARNFLCFFFLTGSQSDSSSAFFRFSSALPTKPACEDRIHGSLFDSLRPPAVSVRQVLRPRWQREKPLLLPCSQLAASTFSTLLAVSLYLSGAAQSRMHAAMPQPPPSLEQRK